MRHLGFTQIAPPTRKALQEEVEMLLLMKLLNDVRKSVREKKHQKKK